MRLHYNFNFGALAAGISSSTQTITSSQFAQLPVVNAPDYLAIVLNPAGVLGSSSPPEIVWVINHTANDTAVTVVRGCEGTSPATFSTNTQWAHIDTAEDNVVENLVNNGGFSASVAGLPWNWTTNCYGADAGSPVYGLSTNTLAGTYALTINLTTVGQGSIGSQFFAVNPGELIKATVYTSGNNGIQMALVFASNNSFPLTTSNIINQQVLIPRFSLTSQFKLQGIEAAVPSDATYACLVLTNIWSSGSAPPGVAYFSKAIVTRESAFFGIPAGTILSYGGSGPPPPGFLYCDGATYLQTQYPALFAVLGVTYGSGGAGTFNVPNLSGKMEICPGGSLVLGNGGGATSATLSTAQLPSHNHPVASFGTESQTHSHGVTFSQSPQWGSYSNPIFTAPSGGGGGLSPQLWIPTTNGGGWQSAAYAYGSYNTETEPAAEYHKHSLTIGNTGSGASVPTLPPYLVVNKIIKF